MKRTLCIALFVALTLCLACVRKGEPSERQLDEATMALLTTARALHHEADVFEAAGDHASARAAIERVLALRFPGAVDEAEDVRADAWGRLGEIALAAEDPDRALGNANTGLQDSRRDSVLRARLYVVRGRALRRIADRAQQNGDPTTAASRRREAIDALETSIRVNQRVLRRIFDGGVP